ncbi:TolB family protein [Bdellovibrionota bacterium]
MYENKLSNKIVFSVAPDGDEEIYVMDSDGENRTKLVESTEKGISNRTPEWSPDGSQIAFQSNKDGSREIYILTLLTKRVNKLTNSGSVCNHPAWSPDGKKLIFTSDRGNGLALYIINSDGTSEKLISPDGTKGKNIFNPCWTPDGRKIAYMVQGEGSNPDSLWNANSDGSHPIQIGPEGLSIFEFDYSYVNNQIVFDAKVSSESVLGDWDIFTMNVDGSNIKRLTNLEAMSSRPKWLSDGETIVFHSNRFGKKFTQPTPDATLEVWFDWWNQFEICTMNKDGKNVVRLTNNHFRDLHPDG